MLVSKVLCLLLATAVVSCYNYESHVLKSRSGDIMIMNAQPIKGDGMLIAIDNTNEDLASKSVSESISTTMNEIELAPLMSHVVGAAPMSLSVPKQAAAFSSSTIFHKPRANLLLAIPEVGHFVTEELAMANIQGLKASRPSFTLAASFEPRNPLSQLTTLVTGQLPSAHGIIGSEWMQQDTKTAAFDESNTLTHSAVPNVADVVSASFPDSLVVSVSADKQFASAAAPVSGSVSKSIVLSFDSETKTVKNTGSVSVSTQPIDGSVVLQLFDAQNSQALLSKFTKNGGVATLSGSIVHVQPFAGADEANSVNFDLSNEADLAFFAELASVQQLFAFLKDNTASVDDSPDVYTVSLVGFSRMMTEYGYSSDKTKFCARLVDVAVSQILSNFDALYHSDVTAQIVLMGSRPQVDASVRKTVADIIGSNANAKLSVDSTFPHVYIEESLSDDQLKSLCAQLNAAVAQHGMKTECLSQYARMSYVQTKAYSKEDSTSTDTDYADKAIMFQLLLWVSFGLAVVLFGTIYPLIYMDTTKGMYSSYLFAKKYV